MENGYNRPHLLFKIDVNTTMAIVELFCFL